MAWRLVSNFRASEELLTPVARSSSTACRSSPERQCGRPAGFPSLGRGGAKASLGALCEEIPLEFRHRIDHVHGELARHTGEVVTKLDRLGRNAMLLRGLCGSPQSKGPRRNSSIAQCLQFRSRAPGPDE